MPPLSTVLFYPRGRRVSCIALIWGVAALFNLPVLAAEPVAISKSADPIVHDFPGVNSAFLGVSLGISYDDVRARLGRLNTGSFLSDNNDTAVKSVSIEHNGVVGTVCALHVVAGISNVCEG